MTASKAQLEAQKRFDNDKTKTFSMRLKLNRRTDADIVARLEAVDNKQGYIKSLIRADIEKDTVI